MESGFGALDIQDSIIACICMMRHSKKFPQIHFGFETASTVSSRGIYKFPVVQEKMKHYPDFQSSSYDLEACSWSMFPMKISFRDDKPWVVNSFGQDFIWANRHLMYAGRLVVLISELTI
jgi:beta-galactosidase